MTTETMALMLSHEPADLRWGKKALLSMHDAGVMIHISEHDPLDAIQRAGRKIDTQGIKRVKLAGTGWGLEQSWAFWQGFRGPKGQRSVEWAQLSPLEHQELERRLKIVDWVRDTINMSAEDLGPQQLARRVVDLMSSVAGDAVSYRITQGDELQDQNYVGLYAVGRGSVRSPVLLTLDFNPTGNPSAPVFACLVGKGITFDSGGYSLKQSTFMDSMKSDMGGAAIISGALAFAAARGLKQRVKLYLCCADNLVNGNAFKLGDVLHYRNGKTVEVMNTDAEGRLVLADGLIDASDQNPALIIDCATLTGAAKVAVGNDYHALFSFDGAAAKGLLASAEHEKEYFWQLPLAEFHRHQLPSNFADLSNTAGAAYSAGASTAAAFLSHFVKNYQQRWLHIDCSAAYRKSGVEQWSAGATGMGVRTLAHFLLSQAHSNISKSV